jgi:hypothetical protein
MLPKEDADILKEAGVIGATIVDIRASNFTIELALNIGKTIVFSDFPENTNVTVQDNA